MAKLTRKQLKELAHVAHEAERALNYVMREDVVIARRSRRASTVLDYSRAPIAADTAAVIGCAPDPDGSALTPTAKDIGSDLVGLNSALRALREFMAVHAV